MANPLIQVENLYKLFGKHPEKHMPLVHEGKTKDEILAATGHTLGLKNINLTINAGETFVIMGLSGSGKSTLIRHFNRLIDPTEGVIRVEGTDVMQLNKRELEQFRRHKMSMVFQRFGLACCPIKPCWKMWPMACGFKGSKSPRPSPEPGSGWIRSGWRATRNSSPPSSPVVSSSGWASPGRSAPTPKFC